MDSISLAWQQAGVEPEAAVAALRKAEEDLEKFLADVRQLRAWFETLEERGGVYARWSREWPAPPPGARAEGPPPPQGAPRAPGPGADAPHGAGPGSGPVASSRGSGRGPEEGQRRVPWRVRVLEVVAGGRSGREWSLREIGEEIGQPNLRSLRVTVEEMAGRGELAKRVVSGRAVRYCHPGTTAPPAEAVTGEGGPVGEAGGEGGAAA
ncbi:hypothetical protein [Streptomyces eurocidicus]|nr:hypothetical protein [Streptomyces eurocidicus]MBB5122740.1 hypothetical protein [Streptomyces eurocidicus]MBF6055213.1 hypothetical protein [Streptomyces eurocidicus]